MYHGRSQSDSKLPTNLNSSASSMSTTNHSQSISSLQPSTIGRISLYSMREKVILNRMTRMMVNLTPDVRTKVIGQFHKEIIPAIRLNGHLTYCLYITIQNLIHLNVIHILLYHAIFWLNPIKSKNEIVQLIENIENTEYEQTLVISVKNDRDDIIRPTINVHLINKYVYITLIGVSSIELITTFIWTLQKKFFFLIQRNQKWRNRLRLLLIGIILIFYLTFISWLYFHTFITHYLTLIIFIAVLIHFIFLTILDKPNLFRDISNDSLTESFSTTNITRKQNRQFSSPFSMLSSMSINPMNRRFYRSSTSMQSRKMNSFLNFLFLSLISSSRWSSVIEQQLDTHECSTVYTKIRQEADNLWPMVVRRMALQFYRTFASFIFFDLIPYQMMDGNIPSTDHQRYKILIIIFALSTFLTHSVFLFPIKFQVNLHHLSNHLGQWRLISLTRTDPINEWSSECNSYIHGNMIKLSSNSDKYFIAIQYLSNAAHPQSISHSILYRLFGNIKYFLTIQCLLCLILIICQLFWIIRGQFAFEILISILIILNSSYTIFKIIRDRLIIDMINEYESDQLLLTSKQKKSN